MSAPQVAVLLGVTGFAVQAVGSVVGLGEEVPETWPLRLLFGVWCAAFVGLYGTGLAVAVSS